MRADAASLSLPPGALAPGPAALQPRPSAVDGATRMTVNRAKAPSLPQHKPHAPRGAGAAFHAPAQPAGGDDLEIESAHDHPAAHHPTSSAVKPSPGKSSSGHKPGKPSLHALGAARGQHPPPPSQLESGLGRGEPLPPGIAARFGQAYGHDLSDVRVHHATPQARKMGARAFTVGKHVALAPGAPKPGTPDGDQLMGHELAHVVQQSGGAGAVQAEGLSDDGYEAEADRAAGVALSGGSVAGLTPVGRGTVQRQPAPPKGSGSMLGSDTLNIATTLRDQLIIINVKPSDDVLDAFDDAPALIDDVAAYLASLFNPPEGPVPETATFLEGARVRALIEGDLPAWLAGGDMPTLSALLASRAAIMRSQHVRAALEDSLGEAPGTIDWLTLIPSLRLDLREMAGTTRKQLVARDRAEMFLMMLEAEVAAGEPVVGGKTPQDLARAIWDYANRAQFSDEVRGAFGEKFLGDYLKAVAAIKFVPGDFDLSRFEPSGADVTDQVRESILDEFIDNDAIDLACNFLLDDWTVSGAPPEGFFAGMDLEKEQESIITRLTAEFMKRATADPKLARAIRELAADRSRYAILATLVGLGQKLESYNQGLPAIADLEEGSLKDDQRAIADDPNGYYQHTINFASATRNILEHVSAGAGIGEEVVGQAAGIAGKADFPQNFGVFATLMLLGQAITSLQRTVHEQAEKSRARIAERVRARWSTIADAIKNRGKIADEFLQKKWIPTLKEVASQRVRDNAKQIEDWLKKFDPETRNVVGRYRLAAWMIENTAKKLESGEAESAELDGQVVTAKDVNQLHAVSALLEKKATTLESKEGKEKQRKQLEDALEGLNRVLAGIESGKYQPVHFGPSVFAEARKKLGIGDFAEGTTGWDVLKRRSFADKNPFLAWEIQGWKFVELFDESIGNMFKGLALGALTISSILVPGFGGLVLAAVDIGFAVKGGVEGVKKAYATLDLARLDTDQSIQGVSVEDAEKGVKHAWVSLVITLALAGLFAAVLGRMIYKGVQAWRLPFLTQLADANPELLARVLKAVDDTKLANQLLGKFALDGEKVIEALAFAKNPKSLLAIIDQVKDADLARRLLMSTNGEGALLPLLKRFRNFGELENLLGKATSSELVGLFDLVKSESSVGKLLGQMTPARATELVTSGLKVDEAVTLNGLGEGAVQNYFRLLEHGDAGARSGIEALLKGVKTPEGAAAAESALEGSASFMGRFQGRAGGDFVSVFERVAVNEQKVQAAQKALADARAAGGNTAHAEEALTKAENDLEKVRQEVKSAEDILEGRTGLGRDRTVTAVKGEHGAPAYRVSGGGKAAEVVTPTVYEPGSLEYIANETARSMIKEAHTVEPQVTGTLQQLAGEQGGSMVLLENRLKTQESLARKLASKDARARAALVGNEQAVAEEAQKVNDSLRYTMTLPPEKYMSGSQATVEALQARGFKVGAQKNFWLQKGMPGDKGYRGINTTLTSPDGKQLFELQFHTVESLATKQKTHLMYEEMRAVGTPQARVDELKRLQVEESDRLVTPPGAGPP